MYPPFYFVGAFNLSMYGGGWLVFVYLSPPSICSYLSALLFFMLFSFRFFFFFIHCLFFPSSAALQFEGKEEEKGKQDE